MNHDWYRKDLFQFNWHNDAASNDIERQIYSWIPNRRVQISLFTRVRLTARGVALLWVTRHINDNTCT